jgi:hypothetical protein
MGVKAFLDGNAQVTYDNGDVLNAGVLYFYEPGTSTPKAVYNESSLATSLGSEVTLNSAGRKTGTSIWLNGNYKVIVKDSLGNTIRTEDNINPDAASTYDGDNRIFNGSFEDAALISTEVALGWTKSGAGVSRADNETLDGNSYHGRYAAKFTKGSGNANGGYIESASTRLFPVTPGRDLYLDIILKSDSSSVDNQAEIDWLDSDQATVLQTDTVYDDTSSGAPTAWTAVSKRVVLPSTPPRPMFGRLRFEGAQATGADGSTFLDGVRLREDAKYGLLLAATIAAESDASETATASSVIAKTSNVTYIGASGSVPSKTANFQIRRSAAGTYNIMPPTGKTKANYVVVVMGRIHTLSLSGDEIVVTTYVEAAGSLAVTSVAFYVQILEIVGV